MDALKEAVEELTIKGFLDIDIDPFVDLFGEIEKRKKQKNAVILAHYYQDPDIQDIADYVGDSLGLSRKAAETDADMIVFAGVHFMAETAKILSPQKKVVLPDLNAGCSLAESCPPEEFAAFREQHPDHTVVTYVNCTAGIKALSDIVCTSTNAVDIIHSIPEERPIIFAPDKNLGKYLMKKTGREMLLWEGTCMVHEMFSAEKITKLRHRHPGALLIAHPECEPVVLERADFIGSTAKLLSFTKENPADVFIVATEAGIIHQMQKASPRKTFIPAPPNNTCACNDCPHMKLNTLEKIWLCMKYEQPEIELDSALIEKSKRPIERMLEVSELAGVR